MSLYHCQNNILVVRESVNLKHAKYLFKPQCNISLKIKNDVINKSICTYGGFPVFFIAFHMLSKQCLLVSNEENFVNSPVRT